MARAGKLGRATPRDMPYCSVLIKNKSDMYYDKSLMSKSYLSSYISDDIDTAEVAVAMAILKIS